MLNATEMGIRERSLDQRQSFNWKGAEPRRWTKTHGESTSDLVGDILGRSVSRNLTVEGDAAVDVCLRMALFVRGGGRSGRSGVSS
jgi:hypothetical protein